MQKDIQKSKGEISQQKFENQPSTDRPSVGETAGHKLKQVGHDVNANLKENVGVGVGNYSSFEDRKESGKQEQKYEEKKEDLKERVGEKKEDIKQGTQQVTEPIGHKVQEIAHDVNATLKQNVGIGFGNYSSEVDQQKSQEHKEQYEQKIQGVKEKVQDVKDKVQDKKEQLKQNVQEKTDDLKEKAYEGQTGIYTHRMQEVGHTINANLKETIGVGVGDYSSEVDRQKADEHWQGYQEKVKETSKPEVTESTYPIVHKIKEVAHNVNANLKEMIGVGVGNYSSEVDRELSEIHHQKYEEKSSNNTNLDQPSSSENLTPSTSTGSTGSFDQKKEKLEEKLFGGNKEEKTTETKKETENKKFDDSDFPKL